MKAGTGYLTPCVPTQLLVSVAAVTRLHIKDLCSIIHGNRGICRYTYIQATAGPSTIAVNRVGRWLIVDHPLVSSFGCVRLDSRNGRILDVYVLHAPVLGYRYPSPLRAFFCMPPHLIAGSDLDDNRQVLIKSARFQGHVWSTGIDMPSYVVVVARRPLATTRGDELAIHCYIYIRKPSLIRRTTGSHHRCRYIDFQGGCCKTSWPQYSTSSMLTVSCRDTHTYLHSMFRAGPEPEDGAPLLRQRPRPDVPPSSNNITAGTSSSFL